VKTGKIVNGSHFMRRGKRKYLQTVYNCLSCMKDSLSSFPIQPSEYSTMFLHVKGKICRRNHCKQLMVQMVCSSRESGVENESDSRYAEAPQSFFNKHVLANPELSKLSCAPLPLTDYGLLILGIVGVLSVIACIIGLAIEGTDNFIKIPDSAQLMLRFVHKKIHCGRIIKVSSVYNVLLTTLYIVFSMIFINADIQIRSVESLQELRPNNSQTGVSFLTKFPRILSRYSSRRSEPPLAHSFAHFRRVYLSNVTDSGGSCLHGK
jgi:hypothetical protein